MQLPDLAQVVFGLRVAAGAALTAWILLLADRRRWWPADWSLHLDIAASQPRMGDLGELVVVVPARNEAAMLPRTLPRLLKQQEWFRRIVVVDDRSEDSTASTARRLATGTSAEDKLEVVSVEEIPEGWSGKVHAMQRGLEVATSEWKGSPDRQWVLFTDADIQHTTSSLARLLAKADRDDLDLVSVMAVLRTGSLWDWLLVPPFLYFFQLLYPFRRASDPASSVAAAAGGCILVRRSVLEEIGGLEAMADRVIDDIALARLAKRAGARCWLGLDPDMRSIRVYGGLEDLGNLIARTAFEQLGHRYVLVPVVWIGLGLLFLGPPLLLLVGLGLLDPYVAVPAGLAWLLQLVHFLPVVQYLDAPPAFALTIPIAAAYYGWRTTVSAWRHLTGGRTPWRDQAESDGSRG